jgi:formylglycine-generating enzyme required for sulfatase activity
MNVSSMASGTNYYIWVSSIQNGQESGKSSVISLKTATPAATPQRPVPDNFVRINGGTFTMGSPANEPGRKDNEGPQHQVTVNSFYMGKYEVTQKEYQEVMGTNLSHFKGDNLPVEKVSWYDAVEYCNKRSQKEGLTPAYTINSKNVTWNRGANGYRLPTEAEWEYACRAGTTSPFSTGNNITTNQANYNGNNPYNNNAKGEYRQKTTPVGSFQANPWGLYDMHGNVYEWCWDLYRSYSSGAQTDPVGASSGSYRVQRGGDWGNSANGVRSAFRRDDFPSTRGIGFRLARNAN